MTEKEKMLAGKLYIPSQSDELQNEFKRAKKLVREYNNSAEDEDTKRFEILSKLLGHVEHDVHIEPPFRCDYGSNIFIGKSFYANYDLIVIDVCKVTIGDNVFIAPRVGIYTAGHPIDSEVRNSLLEFGKPINIGNNVWIGGNVVINPGVSIGDNVVIGSGSVVTKDIPSNCVAVGNPCKVLRPITEKDKQYWNKLREEYYLN